jgi:hypothetical protein
VNWTSSAIVAADPLCLADFSFASTVGGSGVSAGLTVLTIARIKFCQLLAGLPQVVTEIPTILGTIDSSLFVDEKAVLISPVDNTKVSPF